MSDREPAGEGAARRRRERRLRQWPRHEKLSVQMALSEYKHHSSRGQRKDRAGGEVRVVPHSGVLEAPLPQGGSRPPCLGVPRGPHVGLERHVVEDLGELAPLVQILDAPVPQTVEQLVEFFKDIDVEVPAQVIEVPKISQDIIPQRSVDLVPQLVEQLVEVPTVLTPTRIALRIAEQIVNTPVPHGFGGKRRLQGFLPEQSSTAISSSLERISEQIEEQLVDIPSSSGGLGQGSSSSAGPADEDFTVIFRTFPRGKKVRSWLRTRVRGCPPVSAHPRWRLSPCRTRGGSHSPLLSRQSWRRPGRP